MTQDEFKALCAREWKIGYGDVTELHPDEAAYRELADSIGGSVAFASFSKIQSILNETTGTYAKIVCHENHAIVERPPQPPPTSHRVKI